MNLRRIKYKLNNINIIYHSDMKIQYCIAGKKVGKSKLKCVISYDEMELIFNESKTTQK